MPDRVRFPCKHCDKTFASSFAAKRHEQKIHPVSRTSDFEAVNCDFQKGFETSVEKPEVKPPVVSHPFTVGYFAILHNTENNTFTCTPLP